MRAVNHANSLTQTAPLDALTDLACDFYQFGPLCGPYFKSFHEAISRN
jgi:hypothetical protein